MNIFVPIILVGVLVIITLLLIIIDKLLGGGKEKILLINDDTVIPVKNDDTLLNTLSAQKIYIPSACGGKATCGFCKFRLIEGGGEVKPTELPFLSAEERDLGIRLSCQVKVKDNMKIEIPKELLNAQSFQSKVVAIEDQTY
ncbi:MAG: oxidoreductase, partial [Tenericutes bacterium HGW-Tenericutes-8]